MSVTRREMLIVAAAIPAGARAAAALPPIPTLPDKQAFAMTDLAYLDSGSQHPVSVGAKAAVNAYLAKRTLDPGATRYQLGEDGVREKFARLINADKDEIAYVQSTTAGEQLILRALGLPSAGAHIVTDTLHFFGSFPLYEELAKQGCDVTWLRPQDGRIATDDIERAVRPGTRLVAVSAISTYNGFEHDLKRVCEIAHAKGAVVYADIIHAAGCVPFDVKASGVDFAACASYKWLMGDFGLGFVYARKDRQPMLLRTQEGYYGITSFTSHVYPFDSTGPEVADYTFENSAMGHFAFGTYSHMGVAALSHSLDYILNLGVGRIQAHSATLMTQLKRELPRRGYTVVTPLDSRAPMITCVLEGAQEKLKSKLDAAKVRITTSRNRFRVSASVFNDENDVDRLLSALA